MKAPGTLSIAGLLRAHPGRLAALGICAGVIAALGWATAAFVQLVVDRHNELDLISRAAGGLVLIALIRAGLSLVRKILQTRLSRRIEDELSSRFFGHVLDLEMPAYDRHRPGDLVRRLDGLEFVRQVLQESVLGIAFDGVLVVAAAGILMRYSVPLALLAIAGALVPTAVVILTHRGVKKIFAEGQQIRGRMTQDTIESIRGIRDLRVLGAEDWARNRLEQGHARLQAVRERHAFRIGVVQALTTLLSSLVSTLILLVGAARVGHGLTGGELMFVFTMSGLLLGPLEQLANLWWVFGDASVALARFREVLAEPRVEIGGGSKYECAGAIRFEHVSFGYTRERSALSDVTLDIPAGSSIAIVGESGAGKSTLLLLLAGLYAPIRGRIRVDGRDLAAIPPAEWRRNVGAALQNPQLFETSIEENIRLGRPEAGFEEVRRAARLACAEEFILQRPNGYQTVLTRDGATFSAGQAQRLALARALVRDPRVLLLDEATSNLDAHTEAAVWLALSEGSGRRTTVFVAHRLSSTVRADRIVVLQDGRVAEQGTYRELMEARGLYYRLWKRQIPAGFEPSAVERHE